MAEAFQTETRTFSELHGNGRRYVVPRFQRDYAWTETEWEDLWADVMGVRGSPTARHYLGAIVLQPDASGEELRVIDGQQRLTTLAILSLAVIDRLQALAQRGVDPEDNRARADLLRHNLVSTRDPSSLKQSSRLRLNDTDDGFFQSYLVELKPPPYPKKLKGSNRRLWEAFEYFAHKLETTFGSTPKGEELAEFLNQVVARRLVFIAIRVQDDASAYTVFETLNARGVGLGPADLVKNYLFAKAAVSATDLAEAQRRWASIVGQVPLDDVATLLFHYLNTFESEVRRNRLFDAVKQRAPNREQAFAFIEDLDRAAMLFAALDAPNDDLWESDEREWLRVLRLFGVEQYKTLVMAARDWLEGARPEFAKLLRVCAVVSFRANIIVGRNTGDIQRAYQKAALAITSRGVRRASEVARELAAIYPNDADFQAAFEAKSMSATSTRKPLVKYILTQLERASGGEAHDWETTTATIEHVLPENPGAGWEHVSKDDREAFTQRLGNLALLETALNRQLGGKAFAEKQPVLAESRYVTTKRIDADVWGPTAIQERQRTMAQLAKAIWRLDQP